MSQFDEAIKIWCSGVTKAMGLPRHGRMRHGWLLIPLCQAGEKKQIGSVSQKPTRLKWPKHLSNEEQNVLLQRPAYPGGEATLRINLLWGLGAEANVTLSGRR